MNICEDDKKCLSGNLNLGFKACIYMLGTDISLIQMNAGGKSEAVEAATSYKWGLWWQASNTHLSCFSREPWTLQHLRSLCNPSVLMSAYKQTTTRESKNKPHFVEKHNPRQLLNTNGIFGARIWKSYLGVTSLLREDSKHQNSEGKLGRKCPERKA